MLGIDPGLTGALALLEVSGGGRTVDVQFADMPTARVGKGSVIIEAILAEQIRQLRPDSAYVELVHSMPSQGVVSTFTFGMGFGIVRGVLAALAVPTRYLPPQQWGRAVALPKGDDASRVRACQLFPAVAPQLRRVKDHGRADALLIALAGYRMGLPF